MTARETHAILVGIPVVVENSRPDIDTADVLGRLGEALELIRRHVPHYFRHLRRDFDRILVARYACRGAYFWDTNTCLVELTFTVNRDFSPAQVAATILHEAMHARLHRLGFPLEMADRARQERFCRKAEIEFGSLVPGGGPIVERAMASLHASDWDVAPLVDPILAARRVAEVDRQALKAHRPDAAPDS
jgi:hypothetical protein